MGLVFRAVLVAVFMFACAAPATVYAQQAPSELEVRVKDPNDRPLPNARVYVNGPLTNAVLTPDDGVVRFTDVDPGIYTLRIVLAGYATIDVGEVEVLAGRRKIVAVVLTRNGAAPRPGASPVPGELTEIGRVRARPVTITSIDVDEGSPVRRISENLGDALNKIGGISVNQDLQGGTLTISLRNSSNTISTVGGAPIVGGAAGSLQAVSSDWPPESARVRRAPVSPAAGR